MDGWMDEYNQTFSYAQLLRHKIVTVHFVDFKNVHYTSESLPENIAE